MKHIARLTLFFSLCFAVLFLSSATIQIFQCWINAVRAIPAQSMVDAEEVISALRRALPFALYASILLGLSYTVRREMPAPLAIICLFILAGGLSFAASLGITHAKRMGALPLAGSQVTLGSKGLILTRGNTVMVLLDSPANIRGSRVVSLPGRPLIYQEVPLGPDNAILALPPAPFRYEPDYFFNSILIDLSLTSRQFENHWNEGLIPFGIYAGTLILLLISFRFILELSAWPLANLFFGAMAFRGILAFECFLNLQEIQEFIGAYIGPRIPAELISPLVFGSLALLIMLYTLLIWIARGRRKRHV